MRTTGETDEPEGLAAGHVGNIPEDSGESGPTSDRYFNRGSDLDDSGFDSVLRFDEAQPMKPGLVLQRPGVPDCEFLSHATKTRVWHQIRNPIWNQIWMVRFEIGDHVNKMTK